MKSKECIAMLLAGGQGSRLGNLTESIAKPAVSFGGKYRIIDFTLSNCTNSGIDTVGVLTQYRPMMLNRYIGTGAAWDLDSYGGGVHVLPPYMTQSGGAWYAGTADAIYHNIDFVDSYEPEYVLILSGDHIYRMNYGIMLEQHIQNEADLTVSVLEVPWEEASRYGIMTVDQDSRIVRFSEKPANPDSNLASMGIYIFSWKVLRAALLADHEDAQSDHDFGKNVIPRLLGEGKRLYAYRFGGYWKDVGAIDSYFDAQMDMKKEDPCFDLFDDSASIFSNCSIDPPHFIGSDAVVEDSMICSGCIIEGTVIDSIISSGAVVEKGAVVKNSILLPGSCVTAGCRVEHCIVNEKVKLIENSTEGDIHGPIEVIGNGSLCAKRA